MALNDNALITWEDAKSLLSLSDDDQTNTEFYINSISQRIENVTGRNLKAPAADETKLIDGDGCSKIILPEYPVVSITGLYFDADRAFGSSTEVESDEYQLDNNAGIITLYEATTPEGVDTVKVIYKAGYTTVPADLQQAVLETLRWNLSRFASGNVGFESLSGEGMNARPELNIPASAWQVIQNYRRLSC